MIWQLSRLDSSKLDLRLSLDLDRSVYGYQTLDHFRSSHLSNQVLGQPVL
jgi:hypothetical protein